MKILAFVDIHGDLKALKKVEEKAKRADILVCAGDMSMFEQGLDVLLGRLNKLGKTVLMIHGNHEEEGSLKKECEKFNNIIFIHKKTHKKGNVRFIGYGGGGFDLTDQEFERFGNKIIKRIGKIEKIKKHKKGKKTKKEKEEKGKGKKEPKMVLVTHAPPYGTKLDFLNEFSGNKSITSFVEKAKPSFVICGHFHEHRGEFDYIGKTEVINPGPYGRIIEI
jgi:Icc-related predicted phosphoesterase